MTSIDPILSNAVDEVHTIDVLICRECCGKRGLKPAIHSEKAPYYCIECCNYIDNDGKIVYT